MKQLRLGLFLTMVFMACQKDAPIQLESQLNFQMVFKSGQQSLLFDTIVYRNAVNQNYSVSHLECYVSNIVLHSNEGDVKSEAVYYVNAKDGSGTLINFGLVPNRSYQSMSCLIGVDSMRNVPNGLTASIANSVMEWPVQMGGGYHFLKLEGRVKSADSSLGFAMHLGQNAHLVSVNMAFDFTPTQSTEKLALVMDVNSWFESPNDYDFFKDGRFTMAFPNLMKKLCENGSNVIHVERL